MESKENKWKTWLAGVRNGEKLPKKNQLVILFLVGLLLLVAVFPVPEEGNDDAGISSGDGQDLPSTDDAYGAYLEQKTAQTLENVEGVGEVTVMITLKSSSQKVVEKDRSSTSQTTDEADSSGGTRVTEDSLSDQTSVYEQNSDGSQSPYVSMELSPEIEGVVVIADGGDDAVVIRNITEAVQALFGVEAHKIKIMKRADT